MEAESPTTAIRYGRRYTLRRALAAVLDYSILDALVFAYIQRFGTETATGYQVHGCGHFLVLVTLWAIWLPGPEAVFGRTLGKWIFDLRVASADGSALTAGRAFVRHFLDPIDFFLFGVVALIAASGSPARQRVGDRVAKTRVIDEAVAPPEAG